MGAALDSFAPYNGPRSAVGVPPARYQFSVVHPVTCHGLFPAEVWEGRKHKYQRSWNTKR
jgi:hypothetical protein